MLELDSALAQHIVDRAMAILPHNINVMDAQGLIIGSGDPARLHTRHEGAQLVLANHRTVEIDAQSAACLRGVKAGVNLPLMYAERLIGVLGITGDPDLIRPYAELVRMTAEMLVEQRQLQAERDWQRQQLQTWLRQLFDPGQPQAALQAEAERLGLRLAWPRQVCLIELVEQPASQSRVLAALSAKADPFCAPLGASELLWSRPLQAVQDDDAWLAQADQRGWGVARLLTSDAVSNLDQLRQACLALRDLQAYARARRPALRRLALDEHRLPALLHAQRHNWLLRGWLEPLRRVEAQDASGVLLRTLQSWCELDGQVQQCAQALGIHRNTLRYRLERVAELSGLDLTRLDQRLLLALRLSLFDAG